MLSVLHRLETVGEPSEMRAELSRMLGLAEPVAPEVLERARADDRYAQYLLRSRGHPDLLDMLLRLPDNAAYREGGKTAAPITVSAPVPTPVPTPAPVEVSAGQALSSVQLIAKAGVAALGWAATGFKRVEPDVLERRLAACEACPHLKPAPDRLAYKVTLSSRSDQRVCGACGCTASRKASLPNEACPIEDAAQPGFTRWREPIKALA